MIDLLFLSVEQLVVGFVIASLLLIAVYAAYDFVRFCLPETHGPAVAEKPRAGDWQYENDYFDKITEFRNDFTGR